MPTSNLAIVQSSARRVECRDGEGVVLSECLASFLAQKCEFPPKYWALQMITSRFVRNQRGIFVARESDVIRKHAVIRAGGA